MDAFFVEDSSLHHPAEVIEAAFSALGKELEDFDLGHSAVSADGRIARPRLFQFQPAMP